ncbi:NADP-dependent oxidoreductase [Pseudogemmobacter sonorensis]|uniref:NADP-dependent oxidoreductase n=1 Tax=Pseudogemmobacter sonorensis TaxID=2989681 RepID=UPI003678C31D
MRGNRQVHLVSRPGNGPELGNFALCDSVIADPGPDELLLRTLWLSLDPYMRARMYEGRNYTAPAALDQPMQGSTVARVVASRHPDFTEGDIVESAHGWQEYALSDGSGLRRIDPALAPVQTALGVLGMPGQTGYTALVHHGRPQPGETVVVSAASGAVGSVVGQVARKMGARAVGIAGGMAKCRYLTDDLGFDAAVDHRAPDFAAALAAACPDGADIYYDNVGGRVFRAVLPLMADRGRILVCGTISVDRDAPAGNDGSGPAQDLLNAALVRRLALRGFVYTDPELMERAPEFRARVGGWIRDGSLRWREHVVEGLEAAPEAFCGLFRGENFGRLLVRLAPGETA